MTSRRLVSHLAIAALALAIVPVSLGSQLAAARSALPTTEANITRLTTNLMEQSQFSHHAFDNAMAGAFLDRYIESLDVTRTLFTQPDVEEFARYRATLAESMREKGDTRAAQAIFDRFVKRLQERSAFVSETLRGAPFDFTGHDLYSFDREHAERPHDLAAARELWRQQLRAEYLQKKLSDEPADKIARSLTRRYEQQLQTMSALKTGEVLEVYLNALAHVYDPHSDYFGHEQMENFSIAMNLSLFGIGATLETKDGYCTVRELVPGGPAAKAGILKPGDRIVGVAQAGKEAVDITNVPLSRAVELIRGPKGSVVTLTILPAGTAGGSPPRSDVIVRDEVKLEDQQAKARIVDLPTEGGQLLRVGVIDLPSFYSDKVGGGDERRSASEDVARLLRKLKDEHVRGVVLDLRHNGGGSLSEAISLTGLFIRKGPVVQTRDPANQVEVSDDPDPSVQYDGPLVLLTSRFSASASEILAGALQDYGRAVIVGDSSTFGKGTVQTILPLGRVMDRAHLPHTYDPGALKVTISKFYRPSGSSTQLRGVASDIVLPSSSDMSDVNESALKDALPWDTIAPAPHDQLNRVAPYVDTLRGLSQRRVAASLRFGYLAADLTRANEDLATKSVSLNEAERRLELDDTKLRQTERDNAPPAAKPTTYDITLGNASVAGLPPPETFSAETAKKAPEPSTTGAEDAPSPGKSAKKEDVLLNESIHVLADYVGLLRG